jgi:hypothetical protein
MNQLAGHVTTARYTVPTRDELTPAEDLLAAVSAAAEEHAGAARVLVGELERNCTFTSDVVEAITSGRSFTEAMRVNHSSEVRPALSTAIRLYENARHRLRLHLVRAAIAEGATDGEICELWSFSHEMVRRIKKEIRKFEDAGVPAGGSE